MESDLPENANEWNEETSRDFINYGRYIIPERDTQMHTIASLLAQLDDPCLILDLCCGDGLLEEVLLEKLPAISILGLDGSNEMLKQASQRLAKFGARFQSGKFDLACADWRKPGNHFKAVISSMAIHHLPGKRKKELFEAIHAMLAPGGRFIIADVVEAGPMGKNLAAESLDELVRKRSLELDGNLSAFDFFRREGWNIFRYLDPDDIDKPSPLYEQLKWLEQVGFVEIDVHWMLAGHAIFSARKPV
jgi:tRNA (cmo5U34)-methyltransferase